MGLTLTKCAEWVPTKDTSEIKLKDTPLNNFILETIVNFLIDYCTKNENNANFPFKQALSWTTSVDIAELMPGESKEGNISWWSLEKSNQIGLFEANEGNTIKAMNLNFVKDLLTLPSCNKISEMRCILESNSDPVANILGDGFSSISHDVNKIYRFSDDIVNSKMDPDSDEVRVTVKMALDLHGLDLKIMKDILYKISQSIYLDPKAIEYEVNCLMKLSGQQIEKSGILSIEPITLHTFLYENGCRAPPWRQFQGEIAYFLIKFHNGSQVCVTASSNGWFVNNGPESREVYIKKEEKLYTDIVSLLKEENNVFLTFMANIELKEGSDYSIKRSNLSGDTDNSNKLICGNNKSSESKKKNLTKKQILEHQKNKSSALKKTGSNKFADKPEGDGGQILIQEKNKKNIDLPKIKEKSLVLSCHNFINNCKDDIHREDEKEDEPIDVIDPSFALWFTNNSMKIRRYSEIQETVRNRFMANEYTDIITRQRLNDEAIRREKEKKRIHNKETEHLTESSSESEEDEDAPDRRQETSDMSSEYWQIQKLVKYLKGGNQTSTIISLCALRDLPLQTENCQLAIKDVGGLEVLINLLETDEVRCKIGSLKILKEISQNPIIRRAIADLGGLNTMVNILKDPNRDLKCLSAETIANVAKFGRARRTVRQYGGIKKLVGLLDCPSLTGMPNSQTVISDVERDIEVARCVALALWSCSKSKKNKEAMKKAGIISLLSKLLKSNHENMLIPIVGTLQECASEKSYRIAIRTEGMVEDLVKNLKSTNTELQMHCAATIFKCAEEKEIRDLVRRYGGLHPLVSLLQHLDNKELLAAVTGAIWKCAISHENVKIFQELHAIEKLVSLLNDQPEEMKKYLYVESFSEKIKLVHRTEKVLVNVVGGLGELAKDPPNRGVIRKTGGITPLVHLLTGTNQGLLVNTTKAIGRCAEEPESMSIIDKQDGVRLLWSLLKNPNPEVQANAAWAICPCIENAKDAGEMVRSFVGGLELIVSLLKSEYIEVLASVCAVIGKIAVDEENLAVITDHGVVPLLARLTTTTDDILRCQLAEAVSRCCNWGTNRVDFGKAGAVAPLVRYLRSNDENVHRSTAKALNQLSKQPENCVTMHEVGVVKLLLGLVGSSDEVLQEAAASCISNIRRLALANEKCQQQQMKIAN